MDDLLAWLYEYCSQHKIGIRFINYLDSNAPSVCYKLPRMIIYNEKWHDQQEQPFILAHEIGHIMCGTTICYHNKGIQISKNKSECDANTFAINLLSKYCEENDICFDNKYQFATAFGIPNRCFYLLEKVS